MRQVIQDLFLVELYEKKIGSSQLVNVEDVIKIKYLRSYEVDVPAIYALEQHNIPTEPTFNEKFAERLQKELTPLYDILQLGNGKISLCGPDFLSMIFGSSTLSLTDYSPGYFELYFDSCTLEEVQNLLILSLDILENAKNKTCDNTYGFTDNYIYVVTFTDVGLVRFCYNSYNNKGEILRNIGPSIERQGFNLVDGYFATISGAVTAAMESFPIDPNFRNSNCPYITHLCLNLLFHGFDEEIGGKLPISNGTITCETLGANIDVPSDDIERSTKVPFGTIKSLIGDKISPKYYKEKVVLSKDIQGWLGKNYKPFFVGISDDRYTAFSGIRIRYNVEYDIFRLLCSYWLAAEAGDAKQRLKL